MLIFHKFIQLLDMRHKRYGLKRELKSTYVAFRINNKNESNLMTLRLGTLCLLKRNKNLLFKAWHSLVLIL